MKMYCPDQGETRADAIDLSGIVKSSEDNYTDEFIAEEIAQYMHQKSWWEASWPVEFIVIYDSGKEVLWSVDREMIPDFRATRVK